MTHAVYQTDTMFALSQGLGYEIVKGLAQKGCTVLLGARNAELGQAAAKRLQEFGKVQFLELDVTSDSSVDKAAAAVKEQFGRLDILVKPQRTVVAVSSPFADERFSMARAAALLPDECLRA